MKSRPSAHPPGHFYSPVVDTVELEARDSSLWPADPKILGVDFNDDSQRKVIEEFFPRHFGAYDYPEHLAKGEEETRFYTQNSQFSWLDSRSLFVLLLEWKPRRIVEVGSGYSSLLMADVNLRFLGGSCEICCIEPYPREFLRGPMPGISMLLESKVQDIPLEFFDRLEAGDVLFIDSSHVAKTGSDVNFLYFEVLPRLRPGVRIHIHDIPLPHEYNREWVLLENRSWNEQYVLRALLMYSFGFRVIFGCNYAWQKHRDSVVRALCLPNERGFGGGSFWIERCADQGPRRSG